MSHSLYQPSTKSSESTSPTDGREVLLIRWRFKEGRLIEAGANKPILLTNPREAWVIYSGHADIFAVQVENGEAVGSRQHLFRADTGSVLLGVEPGENAYGLLISPMSETRMLSILRERMWETATNPEFASIIADLLQEWIVKLSLSFSGTLPPKQSVTLESQMTLPVGVNTRPKAGVWWVMPTSGCLQLGNRGDLPPLLEACYTPVAYNTWVQAIESSTLQAYSTQDWIAANSQTLESDLERFHQLTLQAIRLNIQQHRITEQERYRTRLQSDDAAVSKALHEVVSVMAAQPASEPIMGQDEALTAAARLVGKALGIQILTPPPAPEGTIGLDPLAGLARESRIQTRKVILKGKWWIYDGGPLLGFLNGPSPADRHPVAVVPTSSRGYVLVDPMTQQQTRIDEATASQLSPEAYVFYRPFHEGAVGVRQLISFATFHSRSDVIRLLAVGILGSLVSMFIPVATGAIFTDVIPASDRNDLLLIVMGLLAAAIASAAFQIVRNIAFLRIGGRADAELQAAVWDRLLSLPVRFFRDYSAGDLATRAMGVSSMRQILAGPVIGSLLSGVFSVFSFILLILYSPPLALAAALLVAIATSITAIYGWLQIRQQRKLMEIQGQISGLVLQFINGFAKFRVAGAESRVFAVWAQRFAAQKRVALKTRTLQNNLAVINATFPIITTMTIFAMIGLSREQLLSTGTFVAFNAAFAQLLVAGIQLSGALVSALAVVPLYERVKPILQVQPEVTSGKNDPGQLSGAIEASHINFRYQQDGPTILRDLSFNVKAGEFIACVGASGSGKSTLLRLLLGFERPDSGGIYYDGRDLANLDLQAVRRQLGVVVQNGKLMAGNIFQNIVGSSLLTLDDAWEAARMAGIESDIRAMPMGMYTLVSEGGGTLSGGQRQRLLIARAIVHKPRIIFFDEATSALDNHTQDIVSKSLESLSVTRIVIAHRLSTISNANRIFVFDNGQIVQVGAYNELMQVRGVFADLARRQTIL
jgi:NHLM bacteriocin system ABC transporter ATP-binding protein